MNGEGKSGIDARPDCPLFFAPMKSELILVVGRRMGKAV